MTQRGAAGQASARRAFGPASWRSRRSCPRGSRKRQAGSGEREAGSGGLAPHPPRCRRSRRSGRGGTIAKTAGPSGNYFNTTPVRGKPRVPRDCRPHRRRAGQAPRSPRMSASAPPCGASPAFPEIVGLNAAVRGKPRVPRDCRPERRRARQAPRSPGLSTATPPCGASPAFPETVGLQAAMRGTSIRCARKSPRPSWYRAATPLRSATCRNLSQWPSGIAGLAPHPSPPPRTCRPLCRPPYAAPESNGRADDHRRRTAPLGRL